MASRDDGVGEHGPLAAEFFAGIGLVRLALESQGARVAFANDIDADKFELYRQNFGAGDFHLGDIHQLSPESIPRCALFTASFPCTDLSTAGAMRGLDSGQSSAFWGLIQVVNALGQRRPGVILLENVPGFLTSHGGADFQKAMLALNEAGYAVDAVMLDAARFTPQSRLRMFVIAKLQPGSAKGGAALASLLPPEVAPSTLRPAGLVAFIRTHPNIAWDLAPACEPPQRSCDLASIVEDLPDEHPAWWNAQRTAYFLNQTSPRHRALAEAMMAAPTVSYGAAFRRMRAGRSMAELRVDGLAGCLRTPRGGSGRQILFKGGHGRGQVRLFTARECARLQGVPDSYRIDVPLNQALFGFGDAVCVPAVAWIIERYVLPALQERK